MSKLGNSNYFDRIAAKKGSGSMREKKLIPAFLPIMHSLDIFRCFRCCCKPRLYAATFQVFGALSHLVTVCRHDWSYQRQGKKGWPHNARRFASKVSWCQLWVSGHLRSGRARRNTGHDSFKNETWTFVGWNFARMHLLGDYLVDRPIRMSLRYTM